MEPGDNEELRKKVANAIVENPDEYGEIIPEILKWYDTVENYCELILQETSPGDDIVLAILSTHFQVEIAVGDWNKRVFRKPFFGERATIPYAQRIYLIMTKYGTKTHYDVLYESFLGVCTYLQISKEIISKF